MSVPVMNLPASLHSSITAPVKSSGLNLHEPRTKTFNKKPGLLSYSKWALLQPQFPQAGLRRSPSEPRIHDTRGYRIDSNLLAYPFPSQGPSQVMNSGFRNLRSYQLVTVNVDVKSHSISRVRLGLVDDVATHGSRKNHCGGVR